MSTNPRKSPTVRRRRPASTLTAAALILAVTIPAGLAFGAWLVSWVWQP